MEQLELESGMRNIKISSRLMAAFGAILLLIILMSAIGLWRLLDTRTANQQVKELVDTSKYVLQWSRQAEVGVTRDLSNGKQALAVTFLINEEMLQEFNKHITESNQHSAETSTKLAKLIDSNEVRRLYETSLVSSRTYREERDRAFSLLSDGDFDSAEEYFNNILPGLAATYIENVDRLAAFIENIGHEQLTENDQKNQSGLFILSGATGFALLLGILFSWRVSRSITAPLSKAVYLASSVANGDLTVDIRPNGKDEVAELERSLLDMLNGLRSNVSEIRRGAISIASAASQISAGNRDLSSRTETQASSLSETAATMEQLTSTVRQNLDNTQQANALATTAATTASDGGTTVLDLVRIMGELNDKSQQIVDIISVIDSIAFQTNILALNAAVEAARAGVQGRGFSVVASEVRALAQKSAGSAREIKTLIDASVEATTRGNQQAARASKAMEEIVVSVDRVKKIMGEITSATHEQTSGIENLNRSIIKMNDVTHQNASLVEESSAAACNMRDRADALTNIVAAFKLNRESSENCAALYPSRPGKTPVSLVRIASSL